MKTLDTTKKTVLAVGSLAIIIGFLGLVNAASLMEQFFPLYTGFALVGTVLLHKEETR